ncbi:ABC transporter permease [Bacillus sp. CLL-7-23]|uniref:ABC transporter permease n=1 Tax=Bacillus changyiensis TaxID=3004103 RepID=A0ABT4X1P7_9BACI|nr:ABC transporter permease [Bacillus changyiensis]MDA7025327.1 ABC transporter permease [Bacillus changyiensis]
MNILNIAKKEIISSFRDKRTLFFMLLFPIVLIIILGTALSSAFEQKLKVDDVQVLYQNQSSGGLSVGFKIFTKEAKKSGINFKKISTGMNGKQEVKQGHYDAYIEVKDSGIKLYQSDKQNIKTSIIQGMLTAFSNQYNAVSEMIKVNPQHAKMALANRSHDNYIKETSINSNDKPRSIDYYAVTMTTLIALYGAMSASFLIRGERLGKTADRLMAAPLRKGEIFTGKLIGGMLTNAICIFLVVMVSKFIFKANWGENLGIVLIVLLTVALFAVSLGLGISAMTKTGEAAIAIINVIIPLVGFLGGAYFPLDHLGGALAVLKKLSPLTWTNEAITNIIFSNDIAAMLPAIAVNIGLSGLLLLIAIVSLRRREGL